MKPVHKSILKYSGRVLFSGAALWLIFRQIDAQALGQALADARWRYVWVVWAWAMFGVWLRSVKLSYILGQVGCEVTAGSVFRISAINSFYSLFMPGLVTTTIKWYMLKRDTAQGTAVLGGMVYNQVTDLLVKLIVGLTALLVADPGAVLGWSVEGRRFFNLAVVAGLVAVVLGTGLLMNRRIGVALGWFGRWCMRILPGSAGAKGDLLMRQLGSFQQARLGFHGWVLLMSAAGTVLISVLIYYFAALAANFHLPVPVIVWLSALVYVLGKIPVSIANLGVRELTIVTLLGAYGVADSAAFLMSMLIFSALVVMALLGLCYQFLAPRGVLEQRQEV